MVRVHSAIPPSRCFTLCSPAAFNVVSAWADRIPLLQYRTISLSSGSWARPAAEPISPLGIKMLPGMCAMSNSAGSRTSTKRKFWSDYCLVRNSSQLITSSGSTDCVDAQLTLSSTNSVIVGASPQMAQSGFFAIRI